MKYTLSRELAEIAERVLEAHPELEANDASIAYVWADHTKRKGDGVVYGDCKKLGEREKVLCGFDFVITFYKSVIDEDITTEGMERLMLHELMHAGMDDGKAYIINHTVEDFRELIDAFGTWDWIHC